MSKEFLGVCGFSAGLTFLTHRALFMVICRHGCSLLAAIAGTVAVCIVCGGICYLLFKKELDF